MIKTITKHMNSTDVIAEIYDTIRVGDYGAYVLNLVLDDLETISGDVRLRFERSDGQIILTAPVTVSENIIIHELTASEIAVVSPLNMWVQFSESNLYTPIQIVFDQVLAVPSGTPIPDTDEYPEYLAAIEAAEAATAEVEAIIGMGIVVEDQTTPQTFINGVPKLAADRVIDQDNELSDKKYVDDKVATVTADDFNHNDLDGLQGGGANERYHMTAAENAALHAHSNKTALDAVSGVNTGDQSASSFNHDDLSNKNGGADYQHMTAAQMAALHSHSNKTALDAVSGTNTGDQDLSGLEVASNKVASISSTSTDTQYPSAKCVFDALSARHYTARWDKVNAQCVRLNDAAGFTTTITNFCHRGTVNSARNNPFDSIAPWKDRNLCNISIDTYVALAAGADIRDCVVSWLGDPDFSYTHANGVWVYTPEFWYKVWEADGYRYFDVSPVALAGYIKSPRMIEGRWHGGVYTLTVGGTSKTCLLPKPGMPGKNTAMSTLHTYAKNFNASVENIYGYSATNILMIVEFATMDTQSAVGNGASDIYRQSGYTIKANATASAVVKILTADASTYCIPGAIFDIGATDGSASVGSYIIASTALDADPTYTNVTLTTDGTTPASVTVTTAHYWSVHGLCNTIDAAIGAASGYIGTNGRCHAYYRGQIAHANMFRYVLGAYRKSGNGGIWIANSEAEADAYDALNQSIHHDTGLLLPQGAGGAATGGYIQTLGLHDGLLAPLCTAIGGGSINPVGDYCYVPSLATGDTVLFAGGYANSGASCGRFYGYWSSSAASSGWNCAAVPVLKSP